MLLTAILAAAISLPLQIVEVKKDTTKKGTNVEITAGTGRRRGRDTLTVVKDSTDSIVVGEHGRKRHIFARRLPVTAQVLATSFRDASAHEMLLRARAARMSQDSA